MKIVIAIDSMKGSLTSIEAGNAAAAGIRRVDEQARISVYPLADGGEGTVEALTTGLHGSLQQIPVTGPLGQPVTASYGILDRDGEKTAVMEMASAAGITLVPADKRNPLYTTTYGVGEMIKDAISKGCRSFIIGIGGSATNDGGIGMLSALGYEFLDSQGNPVPLGARGLQSLTSISDAHVLPDLLDCHFQIACDVTNVLCGENGCSAVFGPQKGATDSMIVQMDQWLSNYAILSIRIRPNADPLYPGTGAAGGLGFAFRTFTNGELVSGIQIILKETGLEAAIRDADLVITGEGCLDGQTAMGKAPIGVAHLAKKYHKTVIAVAGSVSKDAGLCNDEGIDAFFPILRRIATLEEAMQPETAKQNLSDTVEQIFRLYTRARV
ncbi:MAG: glycerate kinase [Agathobacter sp.]